MLACIAPERIASSKCAFTIASYSGVTTNGWSSPSACAGSDDADELRLLGGDEPSRLYVA